MYVFVDEDGRANPTLVFINNKTSWVYIYYIAFSKKGVVAKNVSRFLFGRNDLQIHKILHTKWWSKNWLAVK